MKYEQTITAAVTTDQAWAALRDVTDFPRWTTSITSIEPLDGARLRPGNRYRIRQPGLGVLMWTVTEVRDGEAFTWETRAPGVRTVGYHRLATDPDGSTQITTGVEHTGPLTWLARLLTGARTRRYLEMEAAGLKSASEAVAAAGPA